MLSQSRPPEPAARAALPRLTDQAAGAAAPSPASNPAQLTAATAITPCLAGRRSARTAPVTIPARLGGQTAIRHDDAPALPLSALMTI
jgi:hypothetical protein